MMITITLSRLAPKTTEISNANRIAGNASCTSTMRIRNLSHQPSRQPASSPHRVPINADAGMHVTTTSNDTRAPYMTRDRMSRPRLSVPSGCAQLPPSWNAGGINRSIRTMCSGS